MWKNSPGGELCGENTITVLPIVVVKSRNPYTVCVTKLDGPCVAYSTAALQQHTLPSTKKRNDKIRLNHEVGHWI